MAAMRRLAQRGGVHLSRRIARSIPYLGAVVALAGLAAGMRRKGTWGGLADAGLNALPFVGAAKNAIELLRGEDFFPDHPRPRAGNAPRRR
jgi:hypothetical protein